MPRVGDSWRSTVAGKLESVEHSVMDSSSRESYSLWGVPQRAFTEVSSVRAQRVEVAAGPLESSCLGGWTAAVVDVGVDWLEDHRVFGHKSRPVDCCSRFLCAMVRLLEEEVGTLLC